MSEIRAHVVSEAMSMPFQTSCSHSSMFSEQSVLYSSLWRQSSSQPTCSKDMGMESEELWARNAYDAVLGRL